MQEVTQPHAEAVTVYWGKCSLSLHRMIPALINVKELCFSWGFRPQLEDLFSDASTVLPRLGHDYHLERRPDCPLQSWLNVCQGMMCQDPRDIIFSLISFAPDCGIAVDYYKSVTEVFTLYAQHLVKLHGIFALFTCLLGTRGESLTGLDLPSWVPDLRHKISPELFWAFEEVKYAF